ncbi:MAG: xanthine dehydrogenase family protein molybdopterin-binding subunit [Gammaproteobacteria bacterium]|nr:xanthine dehydrogenase family protein molybdopterin-binding subunit [Gammaproteobacteria bacterium]MDE0257705.1 xanthine dehydrogenase family protein molybdopterin-binding subunit [Gammaproteobacteria bacterium]
MAELIGRDFAPPDVIAKVTGRARYAEDFRADGMLFCRLITSPMPHARVRAIDASEALAMEGVVAILTADEVPGIEAPGNPILTNTPHFVGEPIAALAAVDETTVQDAIAKVRLDLEPLPFVVDPLESLRPGGPNARTEGNTSQRGEGIREVKWTEEDFAAATDGELPMGEVTTEWSYGDVEAGFRDAALVFDETFVTAGTSHHSMEPRTAMAYWQNGRCHVFGSSQSQSATLNGLARYIGIPPEDVVFVGEYCGGGFGSKGSAYPIMSVPAHMSRKTGRPVMMRISRAEEYAIGSARAGFQGRIRMGFRPDGRISAVDLFIVQENGPNSGFGDFNSAAGAVTIVYTPLAMRFRGIPVLTNTPARGAQRGPGQNQIACAVEPLLDKAAAELGIDQLAIRSINAPDSNSLYGGGQVPVTSAHLGEALAQGAERFGWEERRARSGRRQGSRVTGVGIGQAYHGAGNSGQDGLLRIAPDGRLHIHTGVGNLGTYSYAATSRVAAEMLGYDWENVELVRGDTSRNLASSSAQVGSNTTFTMTRAGWAAGADAVEKLKAIAAMELGGSPDDYDIGDEVTFARANPSRRITHARAAARAIELGGRFSGEEFPDDLNDITKRSVQNLAGSGLIGVARDNLPRHDVVPALAAGFIEIELDLETGMYEIIDYLGVADCGTVVHPMGLAAQVRGGAVMGFGMACLERHVYDTRYGVAGNIGFHQAKPPSYLDVPSQMDWDATDITDPQNPVGAKGVGEPLMGCSGAALLCAISDALGGHYFNRIPVVPDMIVNAVAQQPPSHRPLQVNTQ